MITLSQACKDGALELFISERELMDVPKDAVHRYIDASAIPLESSKEDRSKSNSDFSADYK